MTIAKDDGLLLCARYAVSPNFFGYCGPDASRSIRDHLSGESADTDLAHILSRFETVTPYLRLIARANRLPNIYDRRIVEAYWIGNTLLQPQKSSEYMSFLDELLRIDRRLGSTDQTSLKSKLRSLSAVYPHHTFHVLNIFRMYGPEKTTSRSVVESMNQCRISAGTVCSINRKMHTLTVSTDTLTVGSGGILSLKYGTSRNVSTVFLSRRVAESIQIGSLVSIHWGYVCDLIVPRQVKALSRYTQEAVAYYNAEP